MAYNDYQPPCNEPFYQLWEEDGDLIVKLPSYAEHFLVGDIVFIDDVEYEVKGIEHRLTSLEDWGGPVPPAYDAGFSFVLVKVWVAAVC